MITTTIGTLVEAEGALHRLLAIRFDKEGGARVRYHLVKLARLVTAETSHFYEERNKLVEQYGEGDPKTVGPTSPQFLEFVVRVRELGALPAVVSWEPLTDSMLEPYPEATGADLLALGPLFVLS